MLNRIFNRMSHWNFWVPPTVGVGVGPTSSWLMLEKQLLQNQLTEWDVAFRSLLPVPETSRLLLLFHRIILQIFFERSDDDTRDIGWDKYLPQFEAAVGYIEAYMQLVSGSEERRPVFTMDMNIVMPLFLIAGRCRDGNVRRRALAVLKMCNIKEALWDSKMVCNTRRGNMLSHVLRHIRYKLTFGRCFEKVAAVCERIIEIEELGASEEGHIPEQARIGDMDLNLGEEKDIHVTFKKPSQVGNGIIAVFEDTATW